MSGSIANSIGDIFELGCPLENRSYHAGEAFAGVRVATADAPKMCRVKLRGEIAVQRERLVADKSAAAIDGCRVQSSCIKVSLREAIESLGIEITSIDNLGNPWLRQQQVEHVDVVEAAVGDMNEAGNRACQIQQGVQLHRCIGAAETGPRKHRQTQIDGGGVQRVDRVVEFQPERFTGVELPGTAEQTLGELGIDAELLVARQRADPMVALISQYDAVEGHPWQEVHDLAERSLAGVHRHASEPGFRIGHRRGKSGSSRHHIKIAVFENHQTLGSKRGAVNRKVGILDCIWMCRE